MPDDAGLPADGAGGVGDADGVASLTMADRKAFDEACDAVVDPPEEMGISIAALLTGRRLAEGGEERTTAEQAADPAPAVHALLVGLFQDRVLHGAETAADYDERAVVALVGMLRT
ncbi:hypothetical protein [Sinosporangium album]|uniref:hypothetical protein n=1 Tax=Sinosporangium album TaxID=504805 RepID=UPI001C40AFA5|nr:hypothetical protein [Sinosporangium album]